MKASLVHFFEASMENDVVASEFRKCLDSIDHLIGNWTKRNSQYNKSAFDANIQDTHAIARYEGIAIGTRWCLEDFKKCFE